MAERSPERTALIEALRLDDIKQMGALIEQASLDDLEWFAQVVELQLEDTPHWVKDKNWLHRHQGWYRRVRVLVTDSLYDKRLAARRWARMRGFGKDVLLVIIGALLGALLAHYLSSGS